MNRRKFLAAAAATGAGSRILGANDRINVGIIGLGGRGQDHITEYARQGDCRIAALCDVNQAALERAVARVDKLGGGKPRGHADLRRLFDDKNIDAVSIAAPNHWHALAAIWACQAGKDVYVEKPACHNVWEGRRMVEAARKYKRVVQVGSQSRSIAHKIRAMQLLHEGVIGQVYMAKGVCFRRRRSIGHQPDGPVPAGIDWDLFLGPAPMRPYNELRYKYNWHWFWDTGNGDIANQGVHEMDIARWGLNQPGLPRSVVSTGGKFVYKDDQETPNTQLATFDYGDSQIVFEVRGLLTGGEGSIYLDKEDWVGNLFFGSDGWMSVDLDGFQIYKGETRQKVMDEKFRESRHWDTTPHVANFLEAVHTRKGLHADVEVGVTSASLCHLANISYRTGRRLRFDAVSGAFAGDEEANRMLTRRYRAPYVVPERV
jgi:predicted dehydrogenase